MPSMKTMSNFDLLTIMWVENVGFLLCSERFLLRYSDFTLPPKCIDLLWFSLILCALNKQSKCAQLHPLLFHLLKGDIIDLRMTFNLPQGKNVVFTYEILSQYLIDKYYHYYASLALDTSSVLPAPFKLRSRISHGTTLYNAWLSTYERLFSIFVDQIS